MAAGDDVRIVPADPGWPARFRAERTRLLGALAGEPLLAIEHFGSTAVAGLAAKPIIDILVAVPSITAARDRFPDRLAALGHVFWADNPKRDRLFFVKNMPPYGPGRTHHVHVCERPSEMWDRLRFRDHLRANAADAVRYAALKRQLAVCHADDREAYTAAKTDFVAAIMSRLAMTERGG